MISRPCPRSSRIVPESVLEGELVESRLEIAGKLLVGGSLHIVELLGSARPDDGGGDGGMSEDPGHGELDHRHARLSGERAQGFHRGELSLAPVAFLVTSGRRAEGEARTRGRPRVAAMLAGEQPAR